MKTNEFLIVVIMRYKLQSAEIKTATSICCDENNMVDMYRINVDMLLLANVYPTNFTKKDIKEQIIADLRMVGILREHLIDYIDASKKFKSSDILVINNHLEDINERYKEYINDIVQDNLLEDFLTTKKVMKEVRRRSESFNEINLRLL